MRWLMLIAALGAVFIVLQGVLGMARGADPRRGNRLMMRRVWLQLLAVLVFGVLAWSKK